MTTRQGVDHLLEAWKADEDLLSTIRDQAEAELKQHPGNAFAEYLAIILPSQRAST